MLPIFKDLKGEAERRGKIIIRGRPGRCGVPEAPGGGSGHPHRSSKRRPLRGRQKNAHWTWHLGYLVVVIASHFHRQLRRETGLRGLGSEWQSVDKIARMG